MNGFLFRDLSLSQLWVKTDENFETFFSVRRMYDAQCAQTSAGKKKKLNEPIEGNIRSPADSQVMALIIPQLSFGTISEPQWDVMIENSNNDQSASQCVPWDTQGELMDEMSGLGNT